MNLKKLLVLVFGILAIQLCTPNLNATEVSSKVIEQGTVRYAPVNPTWEEVLAADPTDIVRFEDETLAAGIATQLEITVETITVQSMATLTDFSLQNAGVTSLSGLEYARNLRHLWVPENNISDLSPLSNLPKLNQLIITENNISDLSPLSSVTSLSYISASNNKISDLTPIANITKLQTLILSNNQISDITPLTNLTNVSFLILYNNNVSDISPLTNLVKMEQLSMPFNNISDITPLENMNKLTYLAISDNNISDISPIADIVTSDIFYWGECINQTIVLPDITVNSADQIEYNLTGLDGSKTTVPLGVPVVGENNFEKNRSLTAPSNFRTSFNIKQKVTYREVIGEDNATIPEEQPLTDEQLIELFNVVSVENKLLSVDQSAVNYTVPGTYDVVFADELDTITTTLTITDVAPQIAVTQDILVIDIKDTITDYITMFGVSATEITDGDLTPNIIIDDSSVDTSKVGVYTIVFSVEDEEGTNVTKPVQLVIESKNEEVKEIVSEVTSEEKNKDIVDTSKTSDNQKSEVTSESTSTAMTVEKKQTLVSTGSNTAVLILFLGAVATAVGVTKKVTVKK